MEVCGTGKVVQTNLASLSNNSSNNFRKYRFISFESQE